MRLDKFRDADYCDDWGSRPGLSHVDPLALMAKFQALLKARTFTPKSREASSRHSPFVLSFRVVLASMASKSHSRHLPSSAAGWRRFSSANQRLNGPAFVRENQPRYGTRLSQADARTIPPRIISSTNAAPSQTPGSVPGLRRIQDPERQFRSRLSSLPNEF